MNEHSAEHTTPEMPEVTIDGEIKSRGLLGIRKPATTLVEKTKTVAVGSREQAAGQLAAAADYLHQHAEQLPGGERTTSIAHKAADSAGSVAEHIRTDSPKQVVPGLRGMIGRHPFRFAVMLLAIALLVVRAIRA